MKKYVISLFILILSFTSYINVNASSESDGAILKRSDLLNIMLQIDFSSDLSKSEIDSINKVNLNFNDISSFDLSKSEVFNLKYLVYVGALNNSSEFNGANELKVSHYKKILSKSFNISTDLVVSDLLTTKTLKDSTGLKVTEISKLVDNKIIIDKFTDADGKLKFTYFNFLNAYYKSTNNVKTEHVVKVNSYDDMYNALIDIDSNSYYKVIFKSDKYKYKELSNLYDKVIADTPAETLINFHTFYNYKRLESSIQFSLLDNKKPYTHFVYDNSLSKFVEVFYSLMDDKTDSFKYIYDYVHSNINYTANGSLFMMISNFGEGEMACNGISRLVYELLKSNDYSVELRGGTSHYWNIVELDGVKTTVDLTTDILKGYGVTLGLSSKEHDLFIKESGINFYNAEYILNRYDDVLKNETSILN